MHRRTIAAALSLALGAVLLVVACHGSSAPQDIDAGPDAHKFGANTSGPPVLFVLSASSFGGIDAGADAADAAPLILQTDASITSIGSSVSGLEHYDFLNIDCKVVGTAATDAAIGQVDVYLQKLVATSPADVWVDFLHLPQVAEGATQTWNVAADTFDAIPVLVGTSTDDAASPALDAGLMAHGHPGTTLRAVVVQAAGVTAPATVTCYITGRVRN